MRSVLEKQNVKTKKVYFNRHYQNLKSTYHGSGKWHIKYKYSEGYSRIHPWSVIKKENCLKARELISRFYHTFHGYWNKNAQSSLHKHGYTLWFSIIFLHIIELTLTKLHVLIKKLWFSYFKQGAILYTETEVFGLPITNRNRRPMFPFDWLIHNGPNFRALPLISVSRCWEINLKTKT